MKTNLFIKLVVICASISISLIPIQRLELPFNVSIVDIWNFFALPFILTYLILNKKKIRMPYATPMWLIIVASLIGTFSAKHPEVSIIMIVKELYIYLWFLLFTALFSNLKEHHIKRILKTWVYVAVLHGFILITQFFSEAFLIYTTAHVGEYGALGAYRPIGLLKNPNLAAIYQAMSIIPLLIIRFSKRKTSIILTILFGSVIATGSMGATLAIMAGMTLFFGELTIKRKNSSKITMLIIFLIIPISIILLLFFLLEGFEYSLNEQLDEMMFSRAKRSADTRFYLWEQINNLSWTTFLVGVGPNQFINDVYNVPLHNDLLAFLVERGVLGFTGLLIFFITAIYRPYKFIRKNNLNNQWLIPIIASLAAIITIIFESMTHQVFHFRSIWMVLAVQEAIIIHGNKINSKISLHS